MNKRAIMTVAGMICFATVIIGIIKWSDNVEPIRSIPTESINGFKDCKMVKMKDQDLIIYIMRCPGSNTSTQWTKSGITYFSNVIESF